MHKFSDRHDIKVPERLNDPFRYSPHPCVLSAAERVTEMMREVNPEGEGKMLGVLIVRDSEGHTGFLAGFSGNINDRNHIEGFVPPIFDLLDPEGEFKKGEAVLNQLNSRISTLETSPELSALNSRLAEAKAEMQQELDAMKEKMAAGKAAREAARAETDDPAELQRLTRESQFEKAELRRRKKAWEDKIMETGLEAETIRAEIRRLKEERASRSDALQQWIFGQYIVSNAKGEKASIKDIFARKGLTPPGGTGECAAPKLLNYAYLNGLQPLAMGEFWYGKASPTAVRTYGHFYPSCTSKCGPLLEFMLEGSGFACTEDKIHGKPEIIYEDSSIAVVSKPSGMPSVPGLDGRESMLEWLEARGNGSLFHPVHRLDMDTSGIMLFAKDENAAVKLRLQFEKHQVTKRYIARLSPADPADSQGFTNPCELLPGQKGSITCPLAPDYDERPRQKVDMKQGKEAATYYEIIRNRPDSSCDVIFSPVSGRTHQLRVHSAHTQGLARPILGDLLYGGSPAPRLHLHAFEITFTHPQDSSQKTFSTLLNCYPEE
jgi:tRNA pseudouridine32 synthase/23S rRNA pseudouridine746 synthase